MESPDYIEIYYYIEKGIMRACVRACACAYVRACVRACARARACVCVIVRCGQLNWLMHDSERAYAHVTIRT